MARPWRIEYEGAVYHVMARGNAGSPIVRDDADRERWMALLGETAVRFDLTVFAFALMTNHYHLFLRTNRPNLSQALHWLNTAYTVRFNRRHRRPGHLFQGRFKSVLVENDSHWAILSVYLHLNPVRAGLCSDPAEYPWTSFPDYARPRPRYPWLARNEVLALFGPPAQNRRRYAAHCRDRIGQEKSVWKDLRHGFILGSERFADFIHQHFLPPKLDPELPDQRKVAGRIQPEEALNMVTRRLEADPAVLRVRHWHHDQRDMAAAMLRDHFALKNAAIAALLHLSPSAITHALHRHHRLLASSRPYQKEWQKCKF